MRSRIFLKLLAAFVLVIAAATVTLDFAARRAWEDSLRREIARALREKTALVAHRVEQDRTHSLQQIAVEEGRAADARVTIIERTGKVLADSEANPEQMENHATRPEFADALQGKVGSSERWSRTLGVPFLYVAGPTPGGAVRLAMPLRDIQGITAQIRQKLLPGSILAFFVATVLAGIATSLIARRLRHIVDFAERVAAGDLSARIAESSQDEIGQVAAALDKTAHRLEDSFAALETSRQELETVLNSMREAVLAVSSDGRVHWANAQMNALLHGGVRLRSPLVESVRDPEFNRAVREAVEQREVRSAHVSSVFFGRTFNVTAAPMPGGGAVAVLYDLTEVERMEKTRRDFIANVSHELRTPLTSIQGYAETLLDTSMSGQPAQEFLEIIRKNAARMSRLTEDLLTLARVESGEHKLQLQPVSPADILTDVEQGFRDRARAQSTELVIENAAILPVNADHDALYQVFANLVDNALKYADSGKQIVLGARDAGNMVEFYVCDFGPGIASEHLPRLFERFYRVDKARSRESGGTGLGLAIAKHIVRAHGGTIRAESELHLGSTFAFTLPTAAVPASTVHP